MTDVDSHLSRTATAYDQLAVPYAEFARDALAGLPLDRAVLAAFAELVRTTSPGPVVELGCGPGQLTAHLRELGLDVFGVDLSPAMIDIASRAYPDLRFDLGSMDRLDLADGSVSGIVSWYSIIHAPPESVPGYLAEFGRVLATGGHLLLGFFESEGDPVTAFDHRVVTAYRWPVDELAELLDRAGFLEVGRMTREPGEGERFRRGHLLVRRAAGRG
ncbi:class I SAM-dependent methyltransferase [Actinoalloteichus sp. AHMU CJ021]|uniref:Methyltransferase domain-containing protein n=1 Tax=Actinoalloteichus caeruleus DSM 43889 TaxID=1120930 RepID=A0ABT1JEP8_ACTCY|nr:MULTISPECIES: class I SAM-dependent methyltransferase [Actinoalloteichus]AUS81108.1 class I SAM-dependent methyltransferase [Actinoalloteichus sp. AHMU CJ021]MCP2330643.1 Methyltransferase domain-containing protein [Actinoalloteichus caeruleus DSM 43889]